MNFNSKNSFISILDFTKDNLEETLRLSSILKQNRKENQYSKVLLNKTLGIYTNKPSLRTRLSFETGILELGGRSLFIKQDEIGINSRESIEDTARVISKYLDLIIIRTHSHQELIEFNKFSQIPVINGLTDLEHPCQALADLFTLKENFDRLKDLKLTYIGDGNNVAHSLMFVSCLSGVKFRAITPKNREIKADLFKKAVELTEKLSFQRPEISNNPKDLLDSDVVYTDVWCSMGTKNNQNLEESFSAYQVRQELLGRRNIPVMHCLPASKDKEISSEVFEENKELIYQQAENRLHAQKALLVQVFSA